MNNRYLIKVCGMREANNIRAVESLGIDLMGFIFYEQSPRCITETPSYLPQKAKRVGVFVNAEIKEVLQRAIAYRLDYIQLHGNETPEYCRKLCDKKLRLIKAFSIADINDLNKTIPYEQLCNYFLFDTKSTDYGGTGKTFDWSILQNYQGNTPFLLSGGIGPESLTDLRTFEHTKMAGIDLNSQFEISPGLKNEQMLNKFLDNFFNQVSDF